MARLKKDFLITVCHEGEEPFDTTVEAFCRDNRGDKRLCRDVRFLGLGDTLRFGGGASPIVTVSRPRSVRTAPLPEVDVPYEEAERLYESALAEEDHLFQTFCVKKGSGESWAQAYADYEKAKARTAEAYKPYRAARTKRRLARG